MIKTGTHYERALADWLAGRGLWYVTVDQAKKAAWAGMRIKSFDFIIYPRRGRTMLADVKGRKFSWPAYQRGNWGQTWATWADIEGLNGWEAAFGPGYLAVLIFAYWLCDKNDQQLIRPRTIFPDLHYFEGRTYAFAAADLHLYQRSMRPRSSSWQTVYVPSPQFRRIALPFGEFII